MSLRDCIAAGKAAALIQDENQSPPRVCRLRALLFISALLSLSGGRQIACTPRGAAQIQCILIMQEPGAIAVAATGEDCLEIVAAKLLMKSFCCGRALWIRVARDWRQGKESASSSFSLLLFFQMLPPFFTRLVELEKWRGYANVVAEGAFSFSP